jgi:hypothetical protein
MIEYNHTKMLTDNLYGVLYTVPQQMSANGNLYVSKKHTD